jgi:two-component system cell cycle sensor histidine kinase PleC
MSHELRTPLNHILGFSEIMSSGIFGPLGSAKYEEYCNDIGKSGRYLLDVIDDILAMSRIEAGRMTLTSESFRIGAAVQQAASEVTAAAAERNIDIAVDVAADVSLDGDRKALLRVLGNLLRNAVKFTPPGGQVSVRAKRLRHGVSILVQDTGVGIPREALDKVVRPFEQPGARLQDGFKGSGLGLAISKSLVELHGGSLRIRSQVGAGTVVMVLLPLQRPQPQAMLPFMSSHEAHHATLH